DGYADPRGSESYNTVLSTARADGIRTLLIDAGLQPQAIVVQGHGESTAAAVSEGDLDQLALERRVTITFQRQSDVGVAAVVER
ncbi:MAG: OmpA family protein, partial [Pseudomonadota bacterium]